MPVADSSLIEVVKGWQSGIGTIIGFAGLLIGGLLTYKLGRRKDRDLARDEARSVLFALYGEILLLRSQVIIVAQTLSNLRLNDEYLSLPGPDYPADKIAPISAPIAYAALVNKLGLLGADDALTVTHFYTNFSMAKEALPFVLNQGDAPPRLKLHYFLRPVADAAVGVQPLLERVEALGAARPNAHLSDKALHDISAAIAVDDP